MTCATGVIGFVFLVSGGTFATWILMLWRVERLVKSAPERLASLACPRCEAVVGVDAAAKVRARREEDMRRLRERAGNAMLRLRIDPFWRFPCPACGVELKFDPGTKRDPLTV